MASKAPESKSPPRLNTGEDIFTPPPPPPPDRNCRDQSEHPSDEKCLGPKGPAPQDEKFAVPVEQSSVRSSQDLGESKGMKDGSKWKIPHLPPRPVLTSASPTKAQTNSEEEKMKQEDRQDSQQKQANSEGSNGAEANSRKRSSPSEDVGNADNTTNSKGPPGLPKELTAKFGPLKCELCNVVVNSTVQARMHYTGKQHDKKVNQFLTNWSRETGQPVPKRMKESAAAKKVALEPKDMYCTVCDLPLTSVQHAQQHYMGKNHQRAVQARDRDPSKWHRAPQGEAAGGTVGMPLSTDPLGLKDLPDGPSSKKGRFFCELCQVMATSQDQLDMHLKGAKHRKAEKAAGVGVKPPSWTTGSNVVPNPSIPPPASSDSILASVIKTEDALSRRQGGMKDYSIYRTPSGDYYCQLCTVICNREDVFHSHMISKKHAKHEKAKREREAIAQGENESAKEFLSNLKKTISGNVEKMSSNLFFCKLCDLSVKSKEELERHIATKAHMDKVGKADPYTCHTCNMSLESEEHLALHCTQEEHKKNLQQDN